MARRGSRRPQWGPLTRADLRGFDDQATRIIVAACEAGGVGRLSGRGHVILRNAQGETMSVGAKSNKSQQVSLIRLRKLFGVDLSAHSSPPVGPSARPVDERPEAAPAGDTAPSGAVLHDEPTLGCPVKGCTAVFVTEGARYSHVEREHHRCRHPGCGYATTTAQGEASHYRIVHLGEAPRRGKTKEVVAAERAARHLQDLELRVQRQQQQIDALTRERDTLRRLHEEAEGRATALEHAVKRAREALDL